MCIRTAEVRPYYFFFCFGWGTSVARRDQGGSLALPESCRGFCRSRYDAKKTPKSAMKIVHHWRPTLIYLGCMTEKINFKTYFVSSVVTNCLLNIFFSFLWFNFNERHSSKSFLSFIIIDKTLNFKPYFVGSLVTNCLLNIFFSFLLFNFNEIHSLKSFLSLINFKRYFVGPVVSKFLFILKTYSWIFSSLLISHLFCCLINISSCCEILTSPSW